MTLSAVLPRRAAARPDDPARNAVRRLAVSRCISMAGTDATSVAVGYAMYAQTQSAMWLSMGLLLTIASGAVLAPFGGRLGDRFDRRKLMIGAELAAAAVFVTLALIHTPAALLALGVVATAIGSAFGPASGAAIAHVAGDRHLSWANGLVSTASNAGKTAGRLGAGAVIAMLGAGTVFLIDALTFIVSAWLIVSVRRAFSAPLTGPAPGDVAGESEPGPAKSSDSGLRLVVRDRKLRLIVGASCISTFAGAFSMTAEVPLVFEIGAGAVGLGALTASFTTGMLAGSWYGGRALHRGNEATGLLVGRLATAAGIALIAVAPSLTPMVVCYLLGGVGGGLMGVASQSLILRTVPDEVRARTLGAIESARNVTFGLGVLGAGTLVGLLGARPVYALVGVTMAIAAVPLARLVMRLGGPRPLRPAAAV